MSAAEVTPGREFWIVSSVCSKDGPDQKKAVLDGLSTHLRTQKCLGPWLFDIPDGEGSLKYGSFDNLNAVADNLPKYDSQMDSIIHRLERQIIELSSARVEFKVKHQKAEKTLTEYLSNWKWDDAKFPKTRPLTDTCQWMMQIVNRLDDDCRNKTNQYNECKTQKANIDKKEGAMLTGVDFIDLLTPKVVKMGSGKPEDDDFIYTEWLTTVTVILPKGADKEFLKTYEKFADDVVPQSARRFDHDSVKDKDGNTVWRVVMFRDAAEPFKQSCRKLRYVTRDFEYSEDAYNKREAARQELETKLKTQHVTLLSLYNAAWSDIMIMWMHVKAMRVFAESALWSGLPPRFAAFVVSPVPGKGDAVRKALADKLVGKAGGGAGPGGKADLDEGEEDYPYVSISFVPLAVPT